MIGRIRGEETMPRHLSVTRVLHATKTLQRQYGQIPILGSQRQPSRFRTAHDAIYHAFPISQL
jgi:hypothetical protein